MSKFKLLLLGWLFTLFWIVNFSSAESYTFTYDWWVWYTPETFTTNIPLNELQVDYQCGGSYCYFDIMANDWSYSDFCFIIYDDWVLSTCNYEWTWTFLIWWLSRESEVNNWNFSTITLSDWQSSWGWDSWGWDSWGGALIIEWTWAFAPVIWGLTNSIWEFIPYVAYLWLWILWVVIWFFAIKWLIKFVYWNTYSFFSSRRKK